MARQYKPLLYLGPFGGDLWCNFSLGVVSPQFGGRGDRTGLEMGPLSRPVVTSYRLPIVTRHLTLTVFAVFWRLSWTDRQTVGQIWSIKRQHYRYALKCIGCQKHVKTGYQLNSLSCSRKPSSCWYPPKNNNLIPDFHCGPQTSSGRFLHTDILFPISSKTAVFFIRWPTRFCCQTAYCWTSRLPCHQRLCMERPIYRCQLSTISAHLQKTTKTASVSTYTSWPSLIKYCYSVWYVW